MMNIYLGCWVEYNENTERWDICWPDCTILESGFKNRGWATRTLNMYREAYELALEKYKNNTELGDKK